MPEKNHMTWILEPRDSLVLRDSRPAMDGEPMRTLPFPWPSTVAGLARTRIGSDEDGCFSLSPQEAEGLREIAVAGPWLIEREHEASLQILFQAPLDCLWHSHGPENAVLERRRLRPADLRKGDLTNLSGELLPLFPVGNDVRSKPDRAPPAFWRYPDYLDWLRSPPDTPEAMPEEFGLPALKIEEQTHVALDETTGRPIDAALFSTESLRFTAGVKDLALAFACGDQRIKPGCVHLGGERRISFLSRSDDSWPSRPADIDSTGSVYRLLLVTPGLFADGFRPHQIDGGRIIAAAVGRPEVISGWDFAKRGPKPCRRMAPAGSVYWVQLDKTTNAEEWIDRHWMSSISDENQDRLDGFGICLVGVQ